MASHIPFSAKPHQHIKMRGGEIARYEGRCGLTQRHRCTTYRDQQGRPVHPKASANRNDLSYTVWLLGDDGSCRGDKKASSHDFAGVEA